MLKTSELTGAALDWAVAKCENLNCKVEIEGVVWLLDSRGDISRNFNPSSNWSWGGPIIEREVIDIISPLGCPTGSWVAGRGRVHVNGPTPLISAMRCYVASKLGDTVSMPEKLTRNP